MLSRCATFSPLQARKLPRRRSVPSLPGVMGKIAAPVVVWDQVLGVLPVESEKQLVFDAKRAAAMQALASQAGVTVALVEAQRSHGAGAMDSCVSQPKGSGDAHHFHGFDDSLFINLKSVIKALAGGLLLDLLERGSREGEPISTIGISV